jgi:hypothetical protein
MANQQKVQTRGAIFGGFLNSKTHIKCDYNKINRSTPFNHRLARVLAEGQYSHFQRGGAHYE